MNTLFDQVDNKGLKPRDSRPKALDREVDVPHAPGSRTSREAAHALKSSGAAKTQLRRYMETLRDRSDSAAGGMTDHAAVALTGMMLSAVNGRRNTAKQKGWVRDSGRTKRGDSGVSRTVWAITDAGRRWLEGGEV